MAKALVSESERREAMAATEGAMDALRAAYTQETTMTHDHELDATTQGPQTPGYCDPDEAWERYAAEHREEILHSLAVQYDIAATFDMQHGEDAPESVSTALMDAYRITMAEVKAAAGW